MQTGKYCHMSPHKAIQFSYISHFYRYACVNEHGRPDVNMLCSILYWYTRLLNTHTQLQLSRWKLNIPTTTPQTVPSTDFKSTGHDCGAVQVHTSSLHSTADHAPPQHDITTMCWYTEKMPTLIQPPMSKYLVKVGRKNVTFKRNQARGGRGEGDWTKDMLRKRIRD